MSAVTADESGVLPTQYVTFFDSLYLPQGLALYGSLRRLGIPFHLTVYAMDDDCRRVLGSLDLPGMEVRNGWQRLPEELTSLRSRRDWVSLLWTSTPFVIADRLRDLPSDTALYYVDADMALFRDPAPVQSDFENSGSSVLITAHNFAPEYEAAASVGEFAVQFLGVRKGGAERVLESWAANCLHACPTTPETGAFGDQKYLDDWPRDFPNEVRISPDPAWFQGPWNATRFPASDAVAYHFHGLRILSNRRVLLTTHYRLPAETIDLVYRPYVQGLFEAVRLITSTGFAIRDQAPRLTWRTRARLTVEQARSRVGNTERLRYLPLHDGVGNSSTWGMADAS